MEAVFITWMFSCCMGASVIYIYEKMRGNGTKRAVEVWNVIVASSAIGGVIGSLITVCIYLLLMFIEMTTGILHLDSILDYIGTTGIAVAFFSNISVSSAYLALTRAVM